MVSSSGTPGRTGGRFGARVAQLGFVLALVAGLAAALSGFGYQMGLWHFRTGFLILRWAFYASLAAAVVSALGLVLGKFGRNALLPGLAGLAIAAGFAYVPWQWKQTLDKLPYIHDITTDTDNPPQFVASVQLRQEDDHPVSYDGPEVAAKQKEAYPDLAPFVTPASKEKVFEAAKAAVTAMGMQLTGADAAEGRIEASQTTFWYGFTDDMVVRIEQTADGTRVDVRSKSRLGRSDLGQNAKRIRAFLAKLETRLR